MAVRAKAEYPRSTYSLLAVGVALFLVGCLVETPPGGLSVAFVLQATELLAFLGLLALLPANILPACFLLVLACLTLGLPLAAGFGSVSIFAWVRIGILVLLFLGLFIRAYRPPSCYTKARWLTKFAWLLVVTSAVLLFGHLTSSAEPQRPAALPNFGDGTHQSGVTYEPIAAAPVGAVLWK